MLPSPVFGPPPSVAGHRPISNESRNRIHPSNSISHAVVPRARAAEHRAQGLLRPLAGSATTGGWLWRRIRLGYSAARGLRLGTAPQQKRITSRDGLL